MLKTGKRLLALALAVLLCFSPVLTVNAAENDEMAVAISEENFPDENFRNWLTETFDDDGNGYLSSEDLECTEIDVKSRSISSLQGIEFFEKLTYLNCPSNQLTSLDVSNNTALTGLVCYYNKLTSLDVSSNTALTVLHCFGNNLTSLDVSSNTALTELTCNGNQLTSLDVSKNTALTYLSCSMNNLTSLDVRKNTALTELGCSDNNLTSLDVSSNTALTYLNCAYNQLTSLDVSSNTALTELECSSNQLTSLDVSNNTALDVLNCDSNQLTSLDVNSNTALTGLECFGNQLTSLDVSNNTALDVLSCSENSLTSLDVRNNTSLTLLNCSENSLTSLDVSNNTALFYLECSENNLTSLDVSRNTALEYLHCDSNQLTSLDVSNNTALSYLFCGENNLTTLDVSANTALSELDCSGNQLTSLDLSNNDRLSEVDCSSNAYEIASNGTISLNTLPGDFQASKASNWTNGSVEDGILTVADVHSPVTYDYDCGMDYTATFTLNITADSGSDSDPVRISGNDRYTSAYAVAEQIKQITSVETFSAIIVADGQNFPDALSGSYLSTEKDAPILLTAKGQDTKVLEYIQNNLVSGGKVYILGGTNSVSEGLEDSLKNAQISVTRLSGNDRYLTNLAILREAGLNGAKIIVSDAGNYADSLSASAANLPILLVNNKSKKLTADQVTWLESLSGSLTFCIVGGENSVDPAFATALEAYGTVERIAGSGREATSAEAARAFFGSPDNVVLAYSRNFPDGLCGGLLAYKVGAPLLLVNSGAEAAAADYVEEKGIQSGYILGGTNSVTEESVAIIFK